MADGGHCPTREIYVRVHGCQAREWRVEIGSWNADEDSGWAQ
jgi:hypothetical protein